MSRRSRQYSVEAGSGRPKIIIFQSKESSFFIIRIFISVQKRTELREWCVGLHQLSDAQRGGAAEDDNVEE